MQTVRQTIREVNEELHGRFVAYLIDLGFGNYDI